MSKNKIIAIAGDWHGNVSYAEAALHYMYERGVRKIIHTGDFAFRFEGHFIHRLERVLAENDQELWFIRGNHDDTTFLNNLPKNKDGLGEVSERILHIPDGFRWSETSKDGNPVTFLGVGGAISIDRDWRMSQMRSFPTSPEIYWADESISDESVNTAISGGVVDVLITHDAPMGAPAVEFTLSLPIDIQADCDDSRRKISTIMEATRPHTLIHGHYHYFYGALDDKHISRVIGLDCDGSAFYENIHFLDIDILSHELRQK